jgi:hypothetical protein
VLQIDDTIRAIAAVQNNDGSIPWFRGGKVDPWDMVEAAMALDVGGRHDEARAVYSWMSSRQRADGAWASSYVDGEMADPTLDANFCAYVAVGAWQHFIATSDMGWLDSIWPTIDGAIEFALALQDAQGPILWARDVNYRPWPGALLTSSSCICLSLRCALACAGHVGEERPDWELSLTTLAHAVKHRPELFEPKDRFSMDWYYPVLAGVLTGAEAAQRLEDGWDEFVIEERGVRCVSDRPWVTAGETAELVLALTSVGQRDVAETIFEWIQHLRDGDGAFWTGATWPDGTIWPAEKPTWGSGAIVLAADALFGTNPTSNLFAGTDLPAPIDLSDVVSDAL